MKNILFILVFLTLFYSCNKNIDKQNESLKTPINKTQINKKLLISSWIDTSNFMLDFTILPNGIARSDNIGIFFYKKWRVNGRKITFSIERFKKEKSYIKEESWEILQLDDKNLVMKRGILISKYIRKYPIGTKR
jgi:hypothetical protein